MTQKSPSAHHHTTLSGCIFTTKACIDSWKKNLLNSNVSSTCLHNMTSIGLLTAEIGAPQQISTGFAFCLRYCRDVTHWRQTKLCTMFGRLLGWYTVYTFSGAVAPDRILPGAKFTTSKSCLPMLAALLYGTPAAGISKTLRCRTTYAVMELLQRAPPILGRAAITLGIGPHSSLYLFSLICCKFQHKHLPLSVHWYYLCSTGM